MPGRYKAFILAAGVTMTGCATSSFSNSGWVRDSALSNLNPAPPSMTPKVVGPEGDPMLDPVYLASQGDFHYTMGEALSLEGRSEKAVEEFKLTLVYDPDSVVVHLRLAQEYVRQGLLTEAMEQAETAVAMDPKMEEARFLLAGLNSSLKMYDAALLQYREIVANNPDNTEAQIYIGAILAEQKKYDEAVEHFYSVAKAPSTSEPERAYYYIGRIRSEQANKAAAKEAEKAFYESLRLKPEYADAALALAGLLREKGRGEAGLKLLRSFQDKFGPNREVARELSKIYLDKEDYEAALEQLEVLESFERDNLNVRVQLALILIERKHYEEAIVRLEDILAQAPDLDKIRFYIAAVYEELKKDESAIENYAMIPPSSTYFADAMVHSAHLHRQAGRFDDAIRVMKDAIKVRDDIPQLYAYYATLLDDHKLYKEAKALLKQAVGQFPDHAQLHFFLGSMEDHLGDYQATISQMKRVLELDSKHVQALNYLAYVYAERDEQLDEAEDMARQALALQPDDGYILDTLGWILYKKNKMDVALRYLEAAYRIKADEAIIAEHLGDVYFRSQLLDKARAMYRRATELEADNEKVGKIRQKLTATEHQLELGQRMPASDRVPSSP